MAALLLWAALAARVDAGPLRVMATTSLIGDVARAVAGPDAEVTSLIPLQVDPHAFDPTPHQMARLLEADIVLANGLGLETFLDKVLAASGARMGGWLVYVSDGRPPRRPDDDDHDSDGGHEGHSDQVGDDEHAHAHAHGDVDPHVWFDPTWVQLWATNIAAALAARDPSRAEDYRARAAAYGRALAEMDAELQTMLNAVPRERRILVTDHDEFGYLADRYGLTIVGALLPNVTTLTEASARSLANVQRRMRETGAQVVVVGQSANPTLADRLARDTGARVVRLHTHSLGQEGSSTSNYIDFMRENMRLLCTALAAESP